jgi:hypothetical protein
LIKRISNKAKRVLKSLKIDLDIFMYNSFKRFRQRRKLRQKIKNSMTEDSHQTFNANQKRSIELNQEDKHLTQVIVTCYFTLKPDPQTGSIRNSADFKYIQPWYDSLQKIGANGIILHDGLEHEFIARYQTPTIQFRYCEMGNYSIFEERWLLYLLFLQQLPQLEKIFFTDSNDVYITKNPFSFITNETALYVGRDNANRIKDSGWLKEERLIFLEESKYSLAKSYEYQWVYNAGVTGGSYRVMLFLTREMAKLIFKATGNHHKDMTLLNIVIHEHFFPHLSSKNWNQKLVDAKNDTLASHSNLITGYPLNSGFKDFDFNSTAYFIHK